MSTQVEAQGSTPKLIASILVPVLIVVIIVVCAVSVTLALVFTWKRGAREGRQKAYMVPSAEAVFHNKASEEKVVTFDEPTLSGEKDTWRTSIIDQHVELPEQVGVPIQEVSV